MPTSTFLILGSNCFSGSSCAAHLLQRDYDVIGISRSPEPPDFMLPHKWVPHERFRFHQLDLNHDGDEIVRIIADERPAYILCFAAQGMVAASWKAPADWFATNTLAMVRLHEQIRSFDFIKKYVHVSTPEVYGDTTGSVDETAQYNPSTPYAVSKAACDLSLLSFYRAYDFPCVITRAATVCGPGQQLYRIIPRTIISILKGEKLRLEGGGKAIRSFVHISDISDATLLCALKGRAGEIYHFSVRDSVSICDLVRKICLELDAEFERHVEMAPPRLGEDAAYQLDYRKAREQLGWQPHLTVEEAIRDTIVWIQDNWQDIARCPLDYVHKA